MNRHYSEVWKEYKIGNHITDDELLELLFLIRDTVSNLEKFFDQRYRLTLDDLRGEQRRLEQYKAARAERD
jgi:hypothetical protein